MNKYYKIFILFTVFIISIFSIKLNIEHTNMQEAKELSIKYEAKAISDLILSFRQTYQEVFIENHIKLDESNINFLPVKTVGKISELFSQYNIQAKIQTVSDNPRNIKNKANERQMESIKYFNKNQTTEHLFKQVGSKYYYTEPLYTTPICLKCHGKRSDAPKVIRDNYDLAYDYKLGDLRGILEIELEQTLMADFIENLHTKTLIISIIIISIFLIILFLYTQYIIRQEKEIQKEYEIIQDKEEYEETVIESTTNAIIAIDSSSTITTYNNAAEQMFGWSKDEMIGYKNIPKLIPSKYHEAHDKASKNFLVTGKSCGIINSSHELEGVRKDGQVFPLKISFGAKWKPKNAIIVASIIDLTKDKEREAMMIQQSKMADMGNMIGNIAHQWRQPLNTISTASSGLKMQKEFGILTDEEFTKFTNGITESTKFLSETIDTFRDFIKEKKEIKEVILQDRIDISTHIVSASLKNNYIKLITNIDYENPIKITMVIGELTQVLINILNNAKDVLIENKIEEPQIELTLTKNNNKAIITIEDNGGGIPLDIMPKIFDPYFTTKHQSQGTGLGLHMSYKIITESLKGKLYVENTSNGAKFFVELPLDTSNNDE